MKRKIVLTVMLAMLLAVLFSVPVWGATSQDVTVTADPAYIAISNTPSTWTLNGITGDSTIAIDTVYYSNPLGDTTTPSTTVVDGECRFTITDTSDVNIDLTVTMSNFAGGDANMSNSDTGANGATTYGAYSWYSGLLYASKVITKTTGSSVLYTSVTPGGADIKWGTEVETQTDAWTGGSSSTSTLTITATKD